MNYKLIKKSRLGVQEVADRIMRSQHYAKDVAGTLYSFSGGVYRPDGREKVAMATKKILRGTHYWDSKLPDQVAQYINIDAPTLWIEPHRDILNVRNGLLDVLTGELTEHTPEHLSAVQLPVTFDPSATSEVWDWYLERSIPRDAVTLAYQIPAYAMLPDRSLQKAGLCVGPGEDGKSIYLSGVSAFIGPSNTSNLSLHRLEMDKFACARLVGKLLNVWADLPSQPLPETSIFKCIVGQDRILGENKFERSFEFTPFAFLLFSSNHYPRMRDAGHAIYRRWEVLPFERTFSDSEKLPKTELLQMLTAPDQLSGVLNKGLELLPNLRKQGFSVSGSSRRAMEEFVAQTDPMAAWLKEHTIPSGYVAMAALLARYNQHARKEQRPEKTQNGFTRDLKRVRPEVEIKQRTVNGKLERCYVGLRMRLTQQSQD